MTCLGILGIPLGELLGFKKLTWRRRHTIVGDSLNQIFMLTVLLLSEMRWFESVRNI
jgi:hypothetical protein